jgi:hypothetical protein
MSWTDETVNIIGDFIANYHLYQRLDLKDYFSAQQPGDLPNEPPIYEAETVIKYCANEKCKAERPYQRAAYDLLPEN